MCVLGLAVGLAHAFGELNGSDLMAVQAVRQLAQQRVRAVGRDAVDHELVARDAEGERGAIGQQVAESLVVHGEATPGEARKRAIAMLHDPDLIILVDVDHSPEDLLSESSAPFYTVEGQKRVACHLNPGGVLGVWSAFDNDDFAEVLASVYAVGHREEVSWPDDEGPEPDYHNVLFFCRI